MQVSTKKILSEIKAYIIITLGLAIYAFSWTGILAPAKVMGGGASGICFLIYQATGGADGGISMGVSSVILNAILVLLGVFTIGAKFGIKTVYAILMLSLFLGLGQAYIPADLVGLTNDKLLSSILGGIMCGAGISCSFMQGGSTGGTDIIAMIFNKYYRVSLGRMIVFCDMIIVGSAYFVFKDISAIIYGYITMGVLGYTLDLIMQGNKQTVQVFIMTKKYKEVADAITQTTPRGVTLLKSIGWYSKQESFTLLTYCRRNEVAIVHSIIKNVDPDAFVTNAAVTGVYGKGFEELKVKKVKNIETV